MYYQRIFQLTTNILCFNVVLPESYDLSRLSAQSFGDCVSANSTTGAFALPSRALGGQLCKKHSVDFGIGLSGGNATTSIKY